MGETDLADGKVGAEVTETAQAPARQQRQRNPEATKRDILVAAREEFCEHGLGGARVDRIAERAAANKRLLYHYLGNKEDLYAAVLLDAYREIRRGESELHLEELPPDEAMRKLVRFTFDHFRANPWFIRLLSTENILKGQFVRKIADIPSLHSPIVRQIRELLTEGENEGLFRPGVDPVHLYISIAGLSYFYFSNIHTLSAIFDVDLASNVSIDDRRDHVEAVIMGYLRA